MPLVSSHFWSLALEMQFYALAPLLVLLPPRALTLAGLALLALGAASSRPAGQFWWAVRPDGLIVGVMLASQVAQRAAWLAKLPRVSLGLAAYWLVVASILARVLSNGGSGFGLVAIAAIFGVVVASAVTREQPETRGRARVARKLGELSYSAYLVHLPLLWGVHAALDGLAPVAVSIDGGAGGCRCCDHRLRPLGDAPGGGVRAAGVGGDVRIIYCRYRGSGGKTQTGRTGYIDGISDEKGVFSLRSQSPRSPWRAQRRQAPRVARLYCVCRRARVTGKPTRHAPGLALSRGLKRGSCLSGADLPGSGGGCKPNGRADNQRDDAMKTQKFIDAARRGE